MCVDSAWKSLIVDWTHLVLASGKLVLQKNLDNVKLRLTNQETIIRSQNKLKFCSNPNHEEKISERVWRKVTKVKQELKTKMRKKKWCRVCFNDRRRRLRGSAFEAVRGRFKCQSAKNTKIILRSENWTTQTLRLGNGANKKRLKKSKTSKIKKTLSSF